MSENDVPTPEGIGQRRPLQFGLRHVLLFQLAVAVGLTIFIVGYPYSALTTVYFLPVFAVLVAIGWLTFPTSRLLRAGPVIIGGLVVYAIMTFMTSVVTDPAEWTRAWVCRSKLRQIAIALNTYHERHGSFPPAYVADKSGRPMHTWRVLILPYLDQGDLYRQYRFDEPWNGPNNRKLASIRIREYECPEQRSTGTPTTSYVAVVQPGSAWPGAKCVRFQDIHDRPSETLFLAEVANSGIHWMEPRDLDGTTMPMAVNPSKGQGISSLHRETGWRRRLIGANVAMEDTTAQCLPNHTPEQLLRALLTIAGGEIVDLEDLSVR